MVLVKYFTFFCFAVGIIPFYCESNQFHNRSLYGTKINTSPKSSCLRFNNIHLVGLCLQTCMANVGIYYMLSYNKDQQACLCCTDFSGSEITDPSWKTYEISKYISSLRRFGISKVVMLIYLARPLFIRQRNLSHL